MGVVDWRAWVAQNGGQTPVAPNPPGTPYATNQAFPGVGPLGSGAPVDPVTGTGAPAAGAPGSGHDLISGALSIPPYPGLGPPFNNATPGAFMTINAVDPFGGWVDQKEFVLNSAGAQVPTMRPAIAGLTSP